MAEQNGVQINLDGRSHQFVSSSFTISETENNDENKSVSRSFGLPKSKLPFHRAALALDPVQDSALLAQLRRTLAERQKPQVYVHRPLALLSPTDSLRTDLQPFACLQLLKTIAGKLRCSAKRANKSVNFLLPIVSLFKTYNFREMLPADVLCGIT